MPEVAQQPPVSQRKIGPLKVAGADIGPRPPSNSIFFAFARKHKQTCKDYYVMSPRRPRGSQGLATSPSRIPKRVANQPKAGSCHPRLAHHHGIDSSHATFQIRCSPPRRVVLSNRYYSFDYNTAGCYVRNAIWTAKAARLGPRRDNSHFTIQ